MSKCPFKDNEVVVRIEPVKGCEQLCYAQWRNGWINYLDHKRRTRAGGCSTWWEPYRSAATAEERFHCRQLEAALKVQDLKAELGLAKTALSKFDYVAMCIQGEQP